jgi:hypothetical protein
MPLSYNNLPAQDEVPEDAADNRRTVRPPSEDPGKPGTCCGSRLSSQPHEAVVRHSGHWYSITSPSLCSIKVPSGVTRCDPV